MTTIRKQLNAKNAFYHIEKAKTLMYHISITALSHFLHPTLSLLIISRLSLMYHIYHMYHKG